MSNIWDQLEHGIITLDYMQMAAVLVVERTVRYSASWYAHRLDAEKQLGAIIERWRFILDHLTSDEMMQLEREKPGIIAQMEDVLLTLEMRLKYLLAELDSHPYWKRFLPFGDLSREVKDAFKAFNQANKDFTVTTRNILSRDRVSAVLTASAATENIEHTVEAAIADRSLQSSGTDSTGAISSNTTLGEMGQALEASSATHDNPSETNDSSASTPAQAPLGLSERFYVTYQAVVATTAALLPPVLRARQLSSVSDAFPV